MLITCAKIAAGRKGYTSVMRLNVNIPTSLITDKVSANNVIGWHITPKIN